MLRGKSSPLKRVQCNQIKDDFLEVENLPDIHELFAHYNKEYFASLLSSCILEWSDRMTLCAGICYLRRQGGHRYCVIRLSRPLLQYRPFSDTIDTLLHEMIHAYLWIRTVSTSSSGTINYLDRDGHGPDFLALARRINEKNGSNITVYHGFHAEVEATRRHVWRCSGPCQLRPPYFGWVRRSMNRPPQAADIWWNQHQTSCGGVYTKVSSPPPRKPSSTVDTAVSGPASGSHSKWLSMDKQTTLDQHWRGESHFARDNTQRAGYQCPACRHYLANSLDALNAHLDLCLTGQLSARSPSETSGGGAEAKHCPVCFKYAQVDLDALNEHIGRCLALSNSDQDESDSPLDGANELPQKFPKSNSFNVDNIIDLT